MFDIPGLTFRIIFFNVIMYICEENKYVTLVIYGSIKRDGDMVREEVHFLTRKD